MIGCVFQVVMLNEAYSRVEYRLEREGFDSVPALIRYYVGNRKPVSQVGFSQRCSYEGEKSADVFFIIADFLMISDIASFEESLFYVLICSQHL